jgi:hypothetical protein
LAVSFIVYNDEAGILYHVYVHACTIMKYCEIRWSKRLLYYYLNILHPMCI